MAGRRRPFATTENRAAGWFAVARVGMVSGPWEAQHEAQQVTDMWNDATQTGATPR